MRKSQKQAVPAEVVQATSNKSHDFFANVEFFANIREVDKVVAIDLSKAVKVDYMRMSRVEMFRKLVRLGTTFEQIALHDYRFYRDTNDRSKSCKEEKQEDLMKYATKRTAKQLRDVLKESPIQSFFKERNLDIKTVSDYKSKMR